MELNHFISKKRIIFFIGLLLIFTGLIAAKYARAMLGAEPEVRTVKKTRERGSILDRNGKILAAATTLYNLSVNKTLIGDVNRLVNILSPPEGTAGADKNGYTVALTIDASIQLKVKP